MSLNRNVPNPNYLLYEHAQQGAKSFKVHQVLWTMASSACRQLMCVCASLLIHSTRTRISADPLHIQLREAPTRILAPFYGSQQPITFYGCEYIARSPSPSSSSMSLMSSSFIRDRNADAQDAAGVKLNAVYEIASYVIIALVAALPAAVSVFAFDFHSKRVGSDRPAYLALFMFFSGVADFWTDSIWTLALYAERAHNNLWQYACIFTFGPHVLSVVVAVAFISKWRYSERKSEYVTRYTLYTCFSV